MMARAAPSPILQLIRRVVEDPQVRELPDADLLQRFHAKQDQAAFHIVLRRHGPMVLDVCRGVLGDGPDADDAFQATFLILAQKAGSIRQGASLGCWLHGVAHRTALKARAQSAVRHKHEAHAPQRQASAADDLSWREVRQVLHEELAGMPERYREPLIMCYLEGATHQRTAARLSLAERTVRERLERGREMLRLRLVKRGLGPAAILAVAAWPTAAVLAAIPIVLVDSTVEAATSVAGGTAASVVSARVAALTQGVLKTMFLTKLKIATASLVAAALLAGGIGAASYTALQARERPDLSNTQAQSVAKTDLQRLHGAWTLVEMETLGKKLTGKDMTYDGAPLKSITLVIDGEKIPKHRKIPADQVTDPNDRLGGVDVQFGDHQPAKGDFLLNETKKPRRIAMAWLFLYWECIYKVEGDTLTICFNPKNCIRPDDFHTAADSDRVLFIFQRAKSDEDKRPPKEAKKDPERPKKLARVPDPSPELHRELYAFDACRHGSEEKFVELERTADELLKKYPARDDRARIHFEVAHVAAQSDIRKHVQRVRKFAARSLALSRDPLQRGMLYSYLGSAAEVELEKTFEDRRRQATLELLTGYAEMLAQELPAKAPELPVVTKLGAEGIDPDSVEAAQARARHAAQMAARKEAEFIRAQVDRRDTLANQLRWLYHPDAKIHGRTPDGPEQLRALAGKMLNDPKAVEALLTRVIEP